ncbi:MAG TPA: dienelactone hydrolase family protein, partial [Pyrinomonadaceae bacterium]|nr:dienelactone hydrolase family protein [Pyrinomonadaceae bacterium]
MGEMVQFPNNGGSTSGYLSVPDSGSGPGVIVIQEWWGLVDHIKEVCDRFASEGFVALAPDLYHGKTTKSPDEAGKLMMAMRIDEAEKDLRAAADYLAIQDSTTSKGIGVVGFCMGGALALYTATKNPKIGACVVFYGGHPNVKPDLPNLHAPMLGLYADRDDFVTPDSVRELERKLKDLGKEVEVKIYPDADHAFFNDARPEVYNEGAAADAWQRTVEFLRK